MYFRQTAAEQARALGLAGWARNVGDEVELVFEGPRPAVEQAVAWCRTGPPRASVEHVEIAWEEPEGLKRFGVRY